MEQSEVFGTSFCKFVLNICLIKAKKPGPPCNNCGTIHQKSSIIPLVGGITFHWVAVGYKFNIRNI